MWVKDPMSIDKEAMVNLSCNLLKKSDDALT